MKERTFLANAAHELRTPLNSANGFVEMVLDGVAGDLSERQREMLSYAHLAIGQLATLVEDVLFLARMDNGEIHLRLTSVDPATILARAIDGIREQLQQKNIAIVQTQGEHPGTIQADGERLRLGIAGLLRGALALIPPNGELVVSTATRETRFCIEIALVGVRLNASDLRHLFDRFSQPHPLGADRAAYLGLGLAIAQATAGLHGAAVHATTDDGNVTLHYEVPLSLS